jgi:hypothetical protein
MRRAVPERRLHLIDIHVRYRVECPTVPLGEHAKQLAPVGWIYTFPWGVSVTVNPLNRSRIVFS